MKFIFYLFVSKIAIMNLTVEFSKNNDTDVMITVKAPEDGVKKNTHIIVCYDKSGSMGCASNPNGDELMKTYSKNDLGAHMVEIIASALGENDTLEIITYDSYVNNLFPRTHMKPEGKEKAISSIKSVTTGGGTALYAGLVRAMDSAKKTINEFGDAVIFMMTDGEPSESPSNGEIQAITDYRNKTENDCRIYTIGIGYDIKSKLLSDLANIGNNGGSFIFIPDGSMMITSTVYSLAYEKSMFAKDVKIGDINLGTIAYGQSKSVIVKFSDISNYSNVNYKSFIENKSVNLDISSHSIQFNPEGVNKEKCINDLVFSIDVMIKYSNIDISKSQETARTILSNTIDILGDHPIIEDMTGEVSNSIKNQETFNKWGAHYLRSLMSAHKNRKSFNFKDPGPMSYDSEIIKNLRTEIDLLAKNIDPPLQSLLNSGYCYQNGAQYNVQPVSSQMFTQSFNNQQGGCIGRNGNVSMLYGTTKLISELKKGDEVAGGAKVICVIKFSDCDTLLMNNGMTITPWHPISVNGTWVFPANAFPNAMKSTESIVYNFILDKDHILVVNGISVCTLGHNFTGDVIEHPFYGTQKVIDDLMKFPGYDEGEVSLSISNNVYDDENNIIGYK